MQGFNNLHGSIPNWRNNRSDIHFVAPKPQILNKEGSQIHEFLGYACKEKEDLFSLESKDDEKGYKFFLEDTGELRVRILYNLLIENTIQFTSRKRSRFHQEWQPESGIKIAFVLLSSLPHIFITREKRIQIQVNYNNDYNNNYKAYFGVKLSCVCFMFAQRKKSNDLSNLQLP